MNASVVTQRRRTPLGDTVTTRLLETVHGVREDITLEVMPLADINKPGRVWPEQRVRDVWSRA